jgi:hypothetical protein
MTGQAAAWTMVRNDDFFLKLWVDYYSQVLPRNQLFILVDGADSTLPSGIEGCQIITFPKSVMEEGWDRKRWNFLSSFSSSLATRFDVVLGGDVDELIVLDPETGRNPIQHILEHTQTDVISPFAIEIIHRLDLEEPLDPTRPILSQRRFGRINATYCKPCIHRVPIKWSIGQHYSDRPELALSKHLFLFHLRYIDKEMLLSRQNQRLSRISDGSGHLVTGAAGEGWQHSVGGMENFLQSFVDKGQPEETDFKFEWQRDRIMRSWEFDPASGFWRHQRLHNRRTYTLPDCFADCF